MSRFLPAFLALLLGGASIAQIPQPPTQPLPAPPPRTSAVPGQDLVPIVFPNSDVKDVLGLYEKLTKKNLVYDNQVMGNVNLVLSQGVPREEAIKIIEINMLLNGFTLVPVENTDIVKVIGIGKNPRSAAIPMYSDELLIPDGESHHFSDQAEICRPAGAGADARHLSRPRARPVHQRHAAAKAARC